MKKSQQNLNNRITTFQILAIAVLVLFSISTQAQSVSIKGVISTSAKSVRFASVTFVNNADTTLKYTATTDTSGNYQVGLITSVSQNNNLPTGFKLEQNYPNPFSTATSISYQLNKQSDVQVTIYDILGREVKRFAVGMQTIGVHGIQWNGFNNLNERVTTGVYFYKLQANGETQVKKMIFGVGEKGVSASLPKISETQPVRLNKELNTNIPGNNFTIRITNTTSTFPAITTQLFNNVVIKKDTTLNFTVNTNGTYPDPNAATIYVNSPLQFIRGFGGQNMPGWIKDLTPGQVKTAFGTGPGQIGLTILRIRVSYDSTQFKIEVPTAKLADSLGAIIMATPWTPPVYYKTNNNTIGGSLKTGSYADYANYLKRFSNFMASNGAPLYAISLQNEPDANVTYESCYWNATQFLNFCTNYAPAIGMKVIMPESENFNHGLSDSTLNDPVASANVSIIAGHIYGGGLTSYPLALSKGKEVWMTEHLVNDTTWAGALATGKEISDCMNANMSAYLWWYIRRSYGLIDESSKVTKRGYVMSQFAKFVRPGFKRVSTNINLRRTVDVTTYTNGSQMVIVAINRNSTSISQTFTIWNGAVGTFTPYETASGSSRNCIQGNDINYINGSFTVTLDPLSIITFVSK
jgi:O-glycosyl hydrolase/flagellar hook assembly protein FlgD